MFLNAPNLRLAAVSCGSLSQALIYSLDLFILMF